MIAAKKLNKDAENALKGINMEIKGWGLTGEKPPEQLTDDGKSIRVAGMKWFPEIDGFMLNIAKLHFGKKKRENTLEVILSLASLTLT